MSRRTLRIATRKSQLALWQAEHVAARLRALHPDIEVELLGLSTQGDRILDVPLAKIGGKGLFVKELETAMLEGRADLAVHSIKDVPMELPDGLTLGAILVREDPRDALVSNTYRSLDEIPHGARLGTSSLRRQCQLRAQRPDLQMLDLRGNVNTRLCRLDDGEYDAIVLAAAGLRRLGMDQRIARAFAPSELLPAAGQGAIGVEYRAADAELAALLAPLHDPDTADCVIAERALNRRLQGGCQVPIAAHARLQDGWLTMHALVGALDGGSIVRGYRQGPRADCEQTGIALADDLLSRGADALLASIAGDG